MRIRSQAEVDGGGHEDKIGDGSGGFLDFSGLKFYFNN